MAGKKVATDFAESVKKLKADKAPTKSRRTLFLTDDTFEKLQSNCERAGVSVSEMIDLWIRESIESTEK